MSSCFRIITVLEGLNRGSGWTRFQRTMISTVAAPSEKEHGRGHADAGASPLASVSKSARAHESVTSSSLPEQLCLRDHVHTKSLETGKSLDELKSMLLILHHLDKKKKKKKRKPTPNSSKSSPDLLPDSLRSHSHIFPDARLRWEQNSSIY